VEEHTLEYVLGLFIFPLANFELSSSHRNLRVFGFGKKVGTLKGVEIAINIPGLVHFSHQL
jgi:hypothetical protein